MQFIHFDKITFNRILEKKQLELEKIYCVGRIEYKLFVDDCCCTYLNFYISGRLLATATNWGEIWLLDIPFYIMDEELAILKTNIQLSFPYTKNWFLTPSEITQEEYRSKAIMNKHNEKKFKTWLRQ